MHLSTHRYPLSILNGVYLLLSRLQCFCIQHYNGRYRWGHYVLIQKRSGSDNKMIVRPLMSGERAVNDHKYVPRARSHHLLYRSRLPAENLRVPQSPILDGTFFTMPLVAYSLRGELGTGHKLQGGVGYKMGGFFSNSTPTKNI